MDLLKDPSNNRQVKNLPAPPHQPLSQELLFKEGLPDWKVLRDHFAKEGRLAKHHIVQLITLCSQIMKNEGNVIHVDDPLTVVGDIHGQFYDLLKVLQMGSDPLQSKYVFLGDFVDRGSFSLEVICLLYAMKIAHPNRVYLLRGNHECRQLTSFFNFRDECKYKQDQEIYNLFMDSFDNMPLSAVINGKFLCVHGGISPELRTLSDIDRLDRFREPPKAGLFCDLLWADPIENDETYEDIQYRGNETRGCSWFFGNRAVQPLLEGNNLISLIRAHEAQLEGFRFYKYNEQAKEFPSVMTIFSAPNYCDVYNNKAAILKFDNCTLNIQQFAYSEHPYLLPHFLDIFSWSVPFVSEKVTEMLHYVLQQRPGEDDDIDQEEQAPNFPLQKMPSLVEKQKHVDVMKNKIKFVSRMMMMQKVLRQENENIIKLKGLCPDKRIPRGILLQGAAGIKGALAQFNKAKEADRINEMWPNEQKY